MTYHRVCN